MIRYAIPKPEPLVTELTNFVAAVRGEPGAQVVTLEEGLATVRIAEALRDSAATGNSIGIAPVKVAVVGLGKIGLPLAVQFAGQGHRVIGADIDERVVGPSATAVPPFPGEAGLAERMADVVGSGALEATTDTATAVSASEAVVVVVPLYVDADGRAGVLGDRRRHGGRRGRTAPGDPGVLRDDAAGGHHPQPDRAAAGGR